MKIQFFYGKHSLTLYYDEMTSKENFLRQLESLKTRFLLYFQGTSILFLVIKTKDSFEIPLSLENIALNQVSPVFVKVPDSTQNISQEIPVLPK
jgi:hypothetical protein